MKSQAKVEIQIDAEIGLQEKYREKCKVELFAICISEPTKVPLVLSIVSKDDFESQFLRKLFQLIDYMQANGETIAASTVATAAHRSGLLDDAGGAAKWGDIVHKNVQNVDHVEFYARELARLAICRRIRQESQALIEAVSKRNADPSLALSSFHSQTSSMTSALAKRATPIHHVIGEILSANNDPNSTINGRKILTGYPSLDSSIEGFYTKNLNLLGGRFGMGKSGMAAELLANVAARSHRSLVFSLEMTSAEFIQRILSADCGVSMNAWHRVRNPDEQDHIQELYDAKEKYHWWIDDNPRHTVQSILSLCQLTKLRDGLDLVIIDNLQIIEPMDSRIEKVHQIKAITEELKRIAKDLDICILLLCQLDTEAGKSRPSSTSWASCKAIEGDADIALILHETNDDTHAYDLIITKVRSRGKRGVLKFTFNGEFQRFEVAGNEHVADFAGHRS